MSHASSTLASTERRLRPLVRIVGLACITLGAGLLAVSWISLGNARHTSVQLATWICCALAWTMLLASNAVNYHTSSTLTVGQIPVSVVSLAPASLSCLAAPGFPPRFMALAIVLFASSMAIVCLFAVWFVRLRLAYKHRQPIAADAVIIVLGAAIRGDEPSPTLANRLNVAFACAQGHPKRTLVLTGGPTHAGGPTEADVMAAYLLQRGVPATQLVLERSARNTRENIERSLRMLANDAQHRQLCVLTSSYHLYRALREGAQQGVQLAPIPAPTSATGRLQQWCREVLTILFAT